MAHLIFYVVSSVAAVAIGIWVWAEKHPPLERLFKIAGDKIGLDIERVTIALSEQIRASRLALTQRIGPGSTMEYDNAWDLCERAHDECVIAINSGLELILKESRWISDEDAQAVEDFGVGYLNFITHASTSHQKLIQQRAKESSTTVDEGRANIIREEIRRKGEKAARTIRNFAQEHRIGKPRNFITALGSAPFSALAKLIAKP